MHSKGKHIQGGEMNCQRCHTKEAKEHLDFANDGYHLCGRCMGTIFRRFQKFMAEVKFPVMGVKK